MDLHFECTQCGACCRNLKIPLTVNEAWQWLQDGHPVQIVCEAKPWANEPSAADSRAQHWKRRAFQATSGLLPVRVVAVLVADNRGDCPNLLPDMRCSIYDRRPLVCRIYPAEINPFIPLTPSRKACPPQAWAPHLPRLTQADELVSAEMRQAIQRSQEADRAEAELKGRLCSSLNLVDTALAQEGFVVHSPPAEALMLALASAMQGGERTAQATRWRLVTNRSETVSDLMRYGADVVHSSTSNAPGYQYLGLKSAT